MYFLPKLKKNVSFFGAMRDNKYVMKSSKLITAVIVFIGTFAFSSALVWLFVGFPEVQSPLICPVQMRSESPFSSDIESFLQQDIRNGRQRSGQIYSVGNYYEISPSSRSFPEYARAVESYSDNSGSLDAGEFPLDFQKAWNKHMKAWRDYSDFLSELKNNPARNKVAKKDFDALESSHNNEINRTWFEVLRVADTYGAEVRGY